MLRQLAIDDMDSAAVVLRMSFDEALPTLAGLHTPDEDRWFFRERMFATCQLWGYFEAKELLGFIAFREGWIDQLYVLPLSQGRGIGTALLRVAQSKSGHLSLWTFLRNKKARLFYEKHHFILVKETDGTRNEEKEPDAMYSWLRDARACLRPVRRRWRCSTAAILSHPPARPTRLTVTLAWKPRPLIPSPGSSTATANDRMICQPFIARPPEFQCRSAAGTSHHHRKRRMCRPCSDNARPARALGNKAPASELVMPQIVALSSFEMSTIWTRHLPGRPPSRRDRQR